MIYYNVSEGHKGEDPMQNDWLFRHSGTLVLIYIYIYIYISWPTIDTAEYVTYRPLILKMLVYQPEMVKIYPSFHHYIQKVSEYNASTIFIFKSVIQ